MYLDARPELRLSLDRLELAAKPRMKLSLNHINGGGGAQDQWEDDWRVNEWLARVKVRENLFVSYGRENLQWGPSFLFSPSNPFFSDNGRRNTYMEVPGMDFGRVVWLPDHEWSVSIIANPGEGANEAINADDLPASVPRYSKSYAIKADYSGRDKYASVILSRKENAETALGFYGGWTATDALLLYMEGMITRGSRALYPVENQSVFGYSMEALHKHDAAFYPVILAGGSYTFMSRGALTIECVHYGPGYNGPAANKYYTLRSRAASAVESGEGPSGLARQTLGMTALTGLRFLRRNYAMLQYSQPDIAGRIGLTFRYTQNMDDRSSQITSILGWEIGKHFELFSVGTCMLGHWNREFTSILHNQWQLGLQYTF